MKTPRRAILPKYMQSFGRNNMGNKGLKIFCGLDVSKLCTEHYNVLCFGKKNEILMGKQMNSYPFLKCSYL